jgi:hypothetical protein
MPKSKDIRRFFSQCVDADDTQRFNEGDVVSHNGGLIEAHTKRIITAVIGYDPDGGVKYRLALPDGSDRGFAYDGELDLWPGDGATLPMPSPGGRPHEESTNARG